MSDRKEMENKTRGFPARCDIYKNSSHVVLNMEMPGVVKDNLDIKIDGDRLFIRGKKDIGLPKGKYLVREIRAGEYYQEFTIDDTIDRNKIEAVIKNGMVTLTLGIKESEKPRRITVVAK